MIVMELGFKAFIGAVVVVAISLFSKSKNYFIAGMIPLFPTFAIISHIIVGRDRSLPELKETVLFGILTLIPYLVYLLALYYLVDRFSVGKSIVGSTLLWFVAAAFLIVIWKYMKV